MMSVCVPPPHNSSSSVDVANHNGSPATPPSSLSLRSSHNQLVSSEGGKQGQATPPKCRKKYALTSIQNAMGLGGDVPAPPSSSSSSSSSNLKLAKNGANQLRKAAELQDQNRNPTDETSLLESHICRLSLDETNAKDKDEDEGVTQPLLKEQKIRSPPPTKKQRSPEDMPLLSIGSSSASSSPETKKDRPRTGAKTDRALNRIQNLPHSDEESSWTTLSQDSASLGTPEDNGQSFTLYYCLVLFS
uniref:Uncharacterized protein n=1 Tax=Astyanax mexicanus TaxID=7994 RepID=A0A8B9H074_ASTMX